MANAKDRESRCGKALTEKQQLLLSRFHDGECGLISKIRAKRLVRHHPAAEDFIDQLTYLHTTCLNKANQPIPTTRDMWGAISARIEQETHAAKYLGERAEHQERIGFWHRLPSPSALAGGLSGAALAALALVVWYKPVEILSFSAPQAALVTNQSLVQPVGIGNTRQLPRRHYQITTSPAHRNPLEVDWMRSSGSLKLIPDPTGSSAIIWIRRREPSSIKPAINTAPRKPNLINQQRLSTNTAATNRPTANR